jgi:hypothetical protein
VVVEHFPRRGYGKRNSATNIKSILTSWRRT